MAIYHLSMKTVSRSAGRSATAAAAYRSGKLGCPIVDQRTGEIHDYTRKAGVMSADLVLPEGCMAMSRSELWNGIELHHKRGDAVVAREFEVALPAELPPDERRRLALDFAREVSNHYQVAADVCVHAPGKVGDQRNHHAHILLSACSIDKVGFGKKVAELDPIHCQRKKIANPAEHWRVRWAELTNERLHENSIAAKIDHRSLEAQGIDKMPTMHLGPVVSALGRREDSEQPLRSNVVQHNQFIDNLNRIEKFQPEEYSEIDLIENGLLELEGEIEDVKRDRYPMRAHHEFSKLYLDAKAIKRPNEVTALLLSARLETKVILLVEYADIHVIVRRKKRTNDENSMLLVAAIAEAARHIINLILRALGIPQIEAYFFSQHVHDCAHRIIDQDRHVLAMTKLVLYAAHAVAYEDSAAAQAWRNEMNTNYSTTPFAKHAGLRENSLIDFCLDGLIAAGQAEQTHAIILGQGATKNTTSTKHKALTIDSLGEINSLLKSNSHSAKFTIRQVQADLRNSLIGSFEINSTKLRNELLGATRKLELGIYNAASSPEPQSIICTAATLHHQPK
jgi:hypothetical protein